jgi:predicted DNA-binding transcriptional regulator AlpA
MLGSPALKIVRQSKPATPPARRVERAEIPPKGNSLHVPLPSTMTDAEIARDLRLSPKTIRRMNDAAKIPAPVTVGARSLRWVRQKIVDWLAAGCPDRETFEALGKKGNP